MGSRERKDLSQLVRERIEERYGGNSMELVRATGIPQQYVHKLVHGMVNVPRREYREKLAPILGLRQIDFFVIGGELTDDEAKEARGGEAGDDEVPWSAGAAELLRAYNEMDPNDRALILALAERLAQK